MMRDGEVNPRDIPGAAVEAHEAYVDEFGARNAEILSGFRASMYRTQAEGSAQTWVSAAVTAARWLESNYRISLDDADRTDVDDYLEWMTGEFASTETAAGKLDGVRKLYEWMYRKGVVEDDISDDLAGWDELGLTKGQTRQAEALSLTDDYVAITREEVEELWHDDNLPSPSLRNEIAIRLLWYTGIRTSEIVRIKIDHIDRDEGRIRIYAPKTDDYRDVWYPPNRMEPLLNEWLQYRRGDLSSLADESEYLLLTHQSPQMRASHVSRIVKDASRNAGSNMVMYVDAAGKKRWKVTGHTLRHSFATYHANKLGTPIHILQDVMGHEKIETTRKYITKDKEAQRRAMQEPWE